jgi:predicted HicB family RNase H-like nuclease
MNAATESPGKIASEHHEEIKRAAEALFAARPDWVTFFRQVMGRNGLIRRFCPTLEALAEFEQSEVSQQIQRMITELRKWTPTLPPPAEEVTRVITVRIPKSLHEALQSEAHQHQTSMNKLCISKLLQLIDHDMIPAME